MTNEEVDRILSARVPGWSEVRDWFLPHETDRGLENVRKHCAPNCFNKARQLRADVAAD